MAGGKETTRQKLINIMYLVLIAMLALNVSDSVLNAFKNLRDSISDSNKNVQTGVDGLYDSFEKTKLKEEHTRALPIWEKAQQAKQYADDLTKYVEEIKTDFIKEGDDIDPETGDVTKRSDMDIATRTMINQGKGAELKQKINDTRDKLIGLLDEKDRANVIFTLKAVDPEKVSLGQPKTWQAANFGDGTPLTAALTVLTKIQADTKNAEAEVAKKLFGKMDEAVVTLDQFAAVAVAPSSYVIQGQPYTAEVFLTASDSKSSPEISVDGSRLPTEGGKGKYSGNTGSEGTHTWVGKVTVKQTDGTSKTYETGPQTYTVAKPSAVVSLDKMNVMYIGLPNPLSVSAPGMGKGDVSAVMEGGSLSKTSDGHYVATVSNVGTAKVTVMGQVSKGVTKALSTTEYRVKRIPDPKAEFAGKTGGSTSSANIKGQDRIFAKLDNFEYEAKFNVTHFTLYVLKPRQDAIIKQGTGNTLGADVTSALNTVTPGTIVIFTNIIAVGPDGLKRDLSPITLTAN